MEAFIETVMNPQLVATTLAALCVFATVLTVALPMLQRDQMNRRMKEMAIERSKMRSARLSDMVTKDRQGSKLRSFLLAKRLSDERDRSDPPLQHSFSSGSDIERFHGVLENLVQFL